MIQKQVFHRILQEHGITVTEKPYCDPLTPSLRACVVALLAAGMSRAQVSILLNIPSSKLFFFAHLAPAPEPPVPLLEEHPVAERVIWLLQDLHLTDPAAQVQGLILARVPPLIAHLLLCEPYLHKPRGYCVHIEYSLRVVLCRMARYPTLKVLVPQLLPALFPGEPWAARVFADLLQGRVHSEAPALFAHKPFPLPVLAALFRVFDAPAAGNLLFKLLREFPSPHLKECAFLRGEVCLDGCQ